ncbi:hypothetical protein FVE85_4269 [Porphyridium purpureum]|uniref:Transmembrane adaptor Erv26 n=1 Tax=Porphyridium purpureum TaxID=35688 RepID=A0A5J4YUB4_PORPP|nr:hypothetical protein FVE85_4269 [Porphyridium purpureum]|eukprot:POR6013..scf229_5
MALPSFFVLLVYVSGYMVLAFGAVCVGCGLYYLADLAEEHAAFAKKALAVAIAVEVVLHVLLLVVDGFPWLPVLLGVLAHGMYLLLSRKFPFIDIVALDFFATCALFVASVIAWFVFFGDHHGLFFEHHLSPGYSVAFFYVSMVFLVPMVLFVGLTISDAEPYATAGSATGIAVQTSQASSSRTAELGGPAGVRRKRNSVISSLVYYISNLWSVVSSKPRRRKRNTAFD